MFRCPSHARTTTAPAGSSLITLITYFKLGPPEEGARTIQGDKTAAGSHRRRGKERSNANLKPSRDLEVSRDLDHTTGLRSRIPPPYDGRAAARIRRDASPKPPACRYSCATVEPYAGANCAPAPSTSSQGPSSGVAMARCGRTHRPALQGAETYGREDHGGHGHEPNGQGRVSDPRDRLERGKRLKDDGDDVARAAHDKLQPRQPE